MAQVVPAVPSFNVDDGFTYLVPERLTVGVGSIVRVKLAGRRVRGYVVGTRTGDPSGLKEIDAVSGDLAVFDGGLLESLRWAAVHYVAPLSVLLAKAAPANLPRTRRTSITAESRYGVRAAVGGDPRDLMTSLTADGGLSVVAPSIAEAEELAAAVRIGKRLQMAAGADAAQATRAWVTARLDPTTVLVGTRELAWWPVPAGRVLVIDEARAAMQDKQTPTVQAGEAVRRRAMVERLQSWFWSPVPSVRLAAHGVHPKPGPRPWPQVEIVDRRPDPAILAPPTVAAVHAAIRGEGRVFLFARSRRFAPAFRCGRCGELRRCAVCAASLPAAGDCVRCGTARKACPACAATTVVPVGIGAGRLAAEARRRFGSMVGDRGSGRPVIVGTERDLPHVGEVALAVVVDGDGLLGAPHYQAEEQALHLMCRVARLVTGRDRRAIVQSFQPDHRVLRALRTARVEPLMTAWLEERERDRLPPRGELLVLDVEGAPPAAKDALAALGASRADVHHRRHQSGDRWIVQGSDLRTVKVGLRSLVQEWRDGGARVRVAVDPRRL